MPHVFVNRPRLHALVEADPSLPAQFRAETINAFLYKFGGVVFIVGSILFFPSMSAYADLGAAIFIFGSLLYLIVTGHDLAEVLHHQKYLEKLTLQDRFEFWAAIAYFVGTWLFIIGSIFFLSVVGLLAGGAWCFVIGSLLFVIGAIINVLQIVYAKSRVTLQLMNLTALSFVVGSVLFAVASVPYLFAWADVADRETVFSYLAWEFVIGSCLFLLGGIFNYWRAWIIVTDYQKAKQQTA